MRPETLLKSVIDRKRRENPRLSHRVLARRIGCSQSMLSQALAGKKPVSPKFALKVVKKLELTAEERGILLGLPVSVSTSPALRENAKASPYLSPEFKELPLELEVRWLDFALLDLTTLRGFRPEAEWIARKLNTSVSDVLDSLERLEKSGFIAVREDSIEKTAQKIYFRPDPTGAAIRAFHRESIRRSLAELDKTDAESIEKRFFQGMTFGVDPELLPELRERMKAALEDICTTMNQSAKHRALYQINMHLFPILDLRDS